MDIARPEHPTELMRVLLNHPNRHMPMTKHRCRAIWDYILALEKYAGRCECELLAADRERDGASPTALILVLRHKYEEMERKGVQ